MRWSLKEAEFDRSDRISAPMTPPSRNPADAPRTTPALIAPDRASASVQLSKQSSVVDPIAPPMRAPPSRPMPAPAQKWPLVPSPLERRVTEVVGMTNAAMFDCARMSALWATARLGARSSGRTMALKRRGMRNLRSRPLVVDRPDGELYNRVGELGLKRPLRSGPVDLESRGRRRNLAVALPCWRSRMGRKVLVPRHRPVAHAVDGEPVLHVRALQDVVADSSAKERVISRVIRIHAEPHPVAHRDRESNGGAGRVDHIRVHPCAAEVETIVHHVDATEQSSGL